MRIRVKIRQLRTERGYSQEFMAFKMGISQSTYGAIETGKVKLTIERIKLIADILEVHHLALMEENLLLTSHPDNPTNSEQKPISVSTNHQILLLIIAKLNQQEENIQRILNMLDKDS